ncbi:hypothetical protein AcetOrient_orf03793 [Acetobacter orientalis]|uniref:Uncharacterized protein n=1 Tax=Acetobacter orientalis TaxID=146474 RepID=A0A2Z5ZJR7_9PROT|nr:hypothetical protein AcetOrient_orf03793 [Acetobacter orientalis]
MTRKKKTTKPNTGFLVYFSLTPAWPLSGPCTCALIIPHKRAGFTALA